MLEEFAKIAPHLANPLVLVGFVLLLSLGIYRTLIKSGLLRPVSARQSGVLIGRLVRYVFVIALLITIAGFGYAGLKAYLETEERIAAGPKVDVNAIVETLTREHREREAVAQEQIDALTKAVTALARQSEEPQAPPGVGDALLELAKGNTDAAEAIFQDTLDRKEAEGELSLKEAAEAARHLGALAFLHDTEKALAAYRKAVQLDPQNPVGWNQLGLLLRRIGDLDDAEDAYKKVLALGKSTDDRQFIAIAYGSLGIVYGIRGTLDRAEEMFLKSLEINEALGRKEGMATAYGNLGNLHQIRGELDRAEEMHRKSLEIEKALGRKVGMASDYGNLGIVYGIRGELDRAEEMFLKSLEIDEALGRKVGMASNYGDLGNLYRIRGDMSAACGSWAKAKALFAEMGIPDKVQLVEGWIAAACP